MRTNSDSVMRFASDMHLICAASDSGSRYPTWIIFFSDMSGRLPGAEAFSVKSFYFFPVSKRQIGLLSVENARYFRLADARYGFNQFLSQPIFR